MKVKMFPVINMAATGANILRLRKERNLTVADLQEYFGFDAPQAIYKWQRGETIPSTDNLLALGYLLGVSMDDILVTDSNGENSEEPQDDSCGDCFLQPSFSADYLSK
ncbi:MAG: helix-turn-helix transcriptional regulator [Clostridia bacterium]|nr:helix-turn-helix transcriptional regulator [Clostridia bacterium]